MSERVYDIIREQGEMSEHRYPFTMWPRRWTTYTGVHEWQLTKLDESQSGNIPNAPGIYTLLALPRIANHPACSYLMYVGQTESLYRRFREYLTKERRESGRPKIFRFLHNYSEWVWFCFTAVDLNLLDTVEVGLRDAYIPPLNNNYSGELSRVVGAFL